MVKPNAQGTQAVIVARYDYDVYGAVRTQSGSSANKFKYVAGIGHPTDEETGLIYMRARYYEPGTGRFGSEDPAQNGINWFGYCAGSPVNLYDPTGRAGERPIPGLRGWTYRVDRYLAGNQWVRDVHLIYRGKDMGSFAIELGRWKHGPHGSIPRDVRKWFEGEFGTVLGVCSVIAYLEQNPLDFIAIMLDIAGEHEEAAQLDAINRELLG
jgi:RHS repeat-associated protein